MRTQVMLVAGLVLAMSAPSAFAAWSGHGSFEPDYPADVDNDLMFADPDVSPSEGVRQVYFNAFFEPEAVSVNPNVGALQSRLITPDFQFAAAYLGVWKDCNNDGYIGLAEGAVIVYSSSLLTNLDTCPDGTIYNAEGWVYEFLWIGSQDNTADPTGVPARMINDTNARVWGDIDLPGGDLTGIVSCYVNPQTGTFSSTGGMLAFVDCNTGYAIAGAVNENDPTGLLAFENPRQPQCSNSALNQQVAPVFANDPKCGESSTPGLYEDQPEGEERAAFTAFDCSAGQSTAVKSPVGPLVVPDPTGGDAIELTDEDGSLATVFVPALSGDTAVNPTGSYYEALDNVYANTADACDPEGLGLIYLSPESSVTSDATYQRESNWALEFAGSDASLGLQFVPLLADAAGGDGFYDATVGDTPTDGGQTVLFDFQGLKFAPFWTGSSGTTVDPYLVRTSDFAPAPAQYYTFYARVDFPGLVLPGGSGVYGSEWCGSDFTEGHVVTGFDCNPDNWWREDKGASAMETELWTDREIGQKPGATYNLRDIDCYDGTVTSAAPGVGLGLTLLTNEGPCASV